MSTAKGSTALDNINSDEVIRAIRKPKEEEKNDNED